MVRSGPFVLLLAAALVLGGAFLIRAWNENRNDLLRRDIAHLKQRLRLRRQEHTDWRVREARASSLRQLEIRIREYRLDLRPPTEAQLLRLPEPDWTTYQMTAGQGAEAAATATPRRASSQPTPPPGSLTGPGAPSTASTP